ncbi:MAG TPA: hypothetical protein VL403_01825 [Candidatus Kryptonia bacterium]|nr:hypothetical protein [Candidatus Kryptonia bacterium]
MSDVGATHASPSERRRSSEPRATPASPLQAVRRGRRPGSVGAIVGSFKSAAAKRINSLRGTPRTAVWQRGYYEHVIRDEDELQRIRDYIATNPQRWASDRENPHRTGEDDFDRWRAALAHQSRAQ